MTPSLQTLFAAARRAAAAALHWLRTYLPDERADITHAMLTICRLLCEERRAAAAGGWLLCAGATVGGVTLVCGAYRAAAVCTTLPLSLLCCGWIMLPMYGRLRRVARL